MWQLASTVTDAELLAAANLRWQHATKKGFRLLNADLWWISLVGERAAASYLGASINLDFLPQFADGGVDFYGSSGNTYDVKTVTASSLKYGLLVVANKPHANRFILACYEPPNTARLIGWTDIVTVHSYEPRAWPLKVVNHVVPVDVLNPMPVRTYATQS